MILTFPKAIISNDFYRNEFETKKTSDLFWFYFQFEHVFGADRFGYANKYSSVNLYDKSLYPFPNFGSSLSFKDCVSKRIEDYIQRSKKENKKIVVSWSGGVDSTCIICAFLLHGADKENFVVLYSKESIEEYPLFFEMMKKENIKLIKFDNKSVKLVYENYAKNHILILGNCGDLLYGSLIAERNMEFYNKPYQDFCKQYQAENSLLENFEDVLSHYKLPIIQTSEFLWWLAFSMRHTFICNSERMELGIQWNIESFYNTREFDDWSCSNFDAKSIKKDDNPENYRPEQKEIIYAFTKDMDYIKTKNKVSSWLSLKIPQPKQIWIVTNNGLKLIVY